MVEQIIPANALSTLSQHIPVYDISSVKKFEKAYKWTLSIDEKFTPRWVRHITLVQIERIPLSKGLLRTCYKLHDIMQPDVTFVAKFGAANRISRNMYFNTVIVQAVTDKCAHLYNKVASVPLNFHPVFVLELVERNHLNNVCIGEAWMGGELKKENVSTNPDDDEFKNIQAFGHFIIHKSNTEILVSDLQRIHNVYVNSNIHTKSGKGFFDRNHGLPALQKFAEGHVCNTFCKNLKLEPLNLEKVSELAPASPALERKNGVKISSNLIAAAAEKTSEKSSSFVQKSKYLQSISIPTTSDAIPEDVPVTPKKPDPPKSPPGKTTTAAPKYFFPPKSPSSSNLLEKVPSSSNLLESVGSPTSKPTLLSNHINQVKPELLPKVETPPTPKEKTNATNSAAPAPKIEQKPTQPQAQPQQPPTPTQPQRPPATTQPQVPQSPSQQSIKPVERERAEKPRERIPENEPENQFPFESISVVDIMHEVPVDDMQVMYLEPEEMDPFDITYEGDNSDLDEYYDYDDSSDSDYDIKPLPPIPFRTPVKSILKKSPSSNRTRHVKWLDLTDFEKTAVPASKESPAFEAPTPNTPAKHPQSVQNAKSSDKSWDFQSFKVTEVKGSQVECICGDETTIYTGSNEGHIAIWDGQGTKVISSFRAHNKAVKSLVLHNSLLFTGSADATINSWDVHTKKSITKASSKSDIHALCVSEAHSLLFSAENDKTVKVWDTHTLQHIKTLTGHTRAVKALFVLGNFLFSGSNDQQVFIWNLNTHRIVKSLVGHEGWIRAIHAVGSTLYTGSQDETVRLWDLNSTECFQVIQSKGPVQSLLPSSQALFSAAGDHIQVWNTLDNSYPCVTDLNNRSPVLCMWRKQNQNMLLCGSITNSLKIWSWD